MEDTGAWVVVVGEGESGNGMGMVVVEGLVMV